ncbi:MAG: dockerin type I repeat-containing protein [Oscillospiraceae bacterium]|nr:dockerin type I repeat-containing protein [Oscillospiraceae bacterium]
MKKSKWLSFMLALVMLMCALPLAPAALADDPPMTMITHIALSVILPEAGDPYSIPIVLKDDEEGYDLVVSRIQDSEMNTLEPGFGTFDASKDYLVTCRLNAHENHFWDQRQEVGVTCDVTGGNLNSLSTTNGTDGSFADVVIVFSPKAPVPSRDYFSVWRCDQDGAWQGGGFTISYLPPDGDIPPDSGRYWDSNTNQIVPHGTWITLKAKPAEGYGFKGWYSGNPDKSEAGDPTYFEDQLLSTGFFYSFYGGSTMAEAPTVCAVFEKGGVYTRPADQIQIWATDGGQVAAKYEITGANPYEIPEKDGTEFVHIGEIVPFYEGDEITAVAKPDTGYSFKGWYHVNIEWGPGEGEKYQGNVIATDLTYTYRPGVTLLPGDTEALRYVCAVFEKGSGFEKGDVDRSGQVGNSDLIMVARHVVHILTLTGEQFTLGDMNDDNVIDNKDIITLARKIVGL